MLSDIFVDSFWFIDEEMKSAICSHLNFSINDFNSKGYHLAECPHVPLGQVALAKSC